MRTNKTDRKGDYPLFFKDNFDAFIYKGLGGHSPDTYTVEGINLNRSHDRRTTIDTIADTMGMTKEDVAEEAQRNEIDLHHFFGDTMQPVPRSIHRSVHHSGTVHPEGN